jgi:hypothetical protein
MAEHVVVLEALLYTAAWVPLLVQLLGLDACTQCQQSQDMTEHSLRGLYCTCVTTSTFWSSRVPLIQLLCQLVLVRLPRRRSRTSGSKIGQD